MINKKKQTKITVELIAKRRVICIRPTTEKKTDKQRRKYLEPKKYEVFKKKEAARVSEYCLKKKMSEQLQISTATSTSEATPTTSSAFSIKQILSRRVRKTGRSLLSSP